MRLLAFGAVFSLLLVAGCEKHVTTAATGTTPVTTGTSPGLTPNSPGSPDNVAPEPGTPGAPPKLDPNAPADPDKTKAVEKLHQLIKQKPAKIDPPNSGGWKTAKQAPLALAKSIDSTFYHLKGGDATISVHYLLPEGEGITHGSAKFPADTTFSVKYPIIEGDPPHPQVLEVRGKGGQVVLFHPSPDKKDAFSAIQSFQPGGSLNGDDVLARWPSDMPRLSMSHFVTGKDVYVPLVTALLAPGSGYTVAAEERVVNYKGTNIKNYRILATRKGTASNKNVKAEIEIVVDGFKYVPVTMRTRLAPATGKATIIEWAGSWKGQTKFNDKEFLLPAG